ncbi:Hsp20/alpha crystallin family protein [bacterium]|nr:Hsp20/alpha crystallin family protein [bacterium]
MALVRWKPLPSFWNMPQSVEKFFDDFLEDKGAEKIWAPEVDIYENEDTLNVEVEVPGIQKEDINISVSNNVLTISGKKELEKEEKDRNYHRVERTYGEFRRTFTLPSGMDTEKIKASYKSGVLKVTLPKEEKAKPKEIPVTVE